MRVKFMRKNSGARSLVGATLVSTIMLGASGCWLDDKPKKEHAINPVTTVSGTHSLISLCLDQEINHEDLVCDTSGYDESQSYDYSGVVDFYFAKKDGFEHAEISPIYANNDNVLLKHVFKNYMDLPAEESGVSYSGQLGFSYTGENLARGASIAKSYLYKYTKGGQTLEYKRTYEYEKPSTRVENFEEIEGWRVNVFNTPNGLENKNRPYFANCKHIDVQVIGNDLAVYGEVRPYYTKQDDEGLAAYCTEYGEHATAPYYLAEYDDGVRLRIYTAYDKFKTRTVRHKSEWLSGEEGYEPFETRHTFLWSGNNANAVVDFSSIRIYDNNYRLRYIFAQDVHKNLWLATEVEYTLNAKGMLEAVYKRGDTGAEYKRETYHSLQNNNCDLSKGNLHIPTNCL